MNKVILMGRLTRDPELRTTASNLSVCSFTLAVARRYKNAQGERDADFINCVAWRQQADLIAKWFHKGERMLVSGTLQSRNWEDQQGNRRVSTEVIIDEIDFINSGRNETYADEAVDRRPAVSNSNFDSNAVNEAANSLYDANDSADADLPFDL